MKKLLTLAIICNIAICISCDKITENTRHNDSTENTVTDSIQNPVAGTTWIWESPDAPITWTFTFDEDEVTLDYKAEFAPGDITTEQSKATYTYNSNTVSFKMIGWSHIVWKYTGTIIGNTMNLVDSGVEKIDITLIKSTESDAEMLESSYNNGVATLSSAGTLKSILGDTYLNIASLKIIGYINGDDIYYLRRMLGDSSYSNGERGKLISLDLSQAIIQKGGEHYYTHTNGRSYYTRSNVIGEYMFYQCQNFANIILPNTAYIIEHNAFSGCFFKSVSLGDNVNLIRSQAFWECIDLNTLHIGKELKKIEPGAFNYSCDIYINDLTSWFNLNNESLACNNLYANGMKVENLTIPENITGIRRCAFLGCLSLKSVEIGNHVTWIDDYAFAECDSLITVTIGDGLETIPHGGFQYCESLKSVTLGKKVTLICDDAFFGCAPDATFYCHATTPPSIGSSSFDTETGKTLYVPDRYLQSYKTSKWANYFDRIIGE